MKVNLYLARKMGGKERDWAMGLEKSESER